MPRTGSRTEPPAPRPVRSRLRSAQWGSIALAVVVAVLVTLAVVDPGLPATDPQLHDGSVYVTNQSDERLGKFNRQVDEFSGSAALGRSADVVQDGNDVLTVDQETHQLTGVDPGSLGLGSAATLPTGADVTLHAGRVVVSDPASGSMWVRPVAEIGGLQFAKTAPDVQLGAGGRSTQGVDGTPYGLSVERGELVRITAEGPQSTDLGFTPSDDVQLSVVGDTPVVLDRAEGKIWIDGQGVSDLPEAATAHLQQPSDRVPELSDGEISVVLATGQGLYGFGPDGLVELGAATGQPAQPVVVAGCAHGAFSADATTSVITRCDRSASHNAEATGWTPGNQVVFRVNRDEVVLNDVVSGDVWLVTEEMRLVQGWDRVTPPEEGEGKETENNETTEMVDPNRSRENRPPVAQDDSLTARAGRTTLLPVTDNDSDPDGDILTFRTPQEIDPAQGRLGVTRGGTALQISVPDSASGTITFEYTIDDGRGGTDTARVSLRIVSADQAVDNSAPVPAAHPRTVTVRSGYDVTTRVLLDWRDPEGDDLVLVSASVEGDDEVATTREGQLTFRDAGIEDGRKEVTVVVSDGMDETTGTVIVQTVDKAVPPVAFGDFVTARTGEEVTVNPLLNDLGDDLVLARIDDAPAGATAALGDENTFTFTAERPGTYYLSYVVSNGPRSFGLVRIDVTDPPEENQPPVTARDLAQLPAGGAVLVDPLANDEDPDNDVLVIQQVSEEPGLEIRVLQRSQLLIIAQRTPERPVVITYTVSDGRHSVPGSVVVMPTKVTKDAPQAMPDTLTVRAGDIGSVGVLTNDVSPSGLDLRLLGLTETPTAGEAWVSGDLVRFRAPSQPGEYQAIYEVIDEQGRKASAQVRIFVIAESASNTAPTPETVVERLLAGTSSRVIIPLRGIDAEGDSVRLVGIDTPPELGRIVSIGDGQLGYEAYPESAGTDTFTYRVRDALGAEAVGTVRIGVVPRGAGNTAPVAVDDVVSARPGQKLRIPVLDNDSDPDGDRLGFASETVDGMPDAKIVDGEAVEIVVPEDPGTIVGTYTIVDSRGAEASATIRITSDPNAPLQSPVLVDDIVPAWEVLSKDQVSVPVLDNDYDPDGDIRAAKVTVPADGVPEEERATVVDNMVQVKIRATMQVIRYQVTDTDGNVAWATITVPGTEDAVPTLKADIGVQEVRAGVPKEFDVTDFALGRDGRSVRLASEDRLWGSNGNTTATGPTTVSFVAPKDYVGPASMSFEVTDGKDGTDESGRTAVLTVPIKVLPAPEDQRRSNKPPEVNPVSLEVAAGEAAESVDLARAVSDPEGDKLTFSKPAFTPPAGLEVRLDGARITAQARADTKVGSTVEGTVTVSDGENKVTVPVRVKVTATTRPLPTAVDDSVAEAVQGKASTVSVLDNDVNPFPDKPLRVIGANVESGQGSVDFTEDSVTVTPAGDFVGTMVVRYTIRDVTNLPGRSAEARIRLTVQGKPDKPGTPRRVQVGDGKAVINWTAPDANGAGITGYTVTATGDGAPTRTQQCTTTTCTITDLTNDVGYRFTVVATNRHGDSEPSNPSAVIRPDVRPEAPTGPKAKFGDRKLTLSWGEAGTRGSAVQSYEIELSGPNGLVLRTIDNATSHTWTGLENGASYTFRVRARNKAPEPSEWSTRSKPEVPAGKPSAPIMVSASDTQARTGREMRVVWDPPANPNGAKVTDYQIKANSTVINHTASGGGRQSRTITVPSNTTYTVTVTAKNKAGWSEASKSATVVVYSAPAKPSAVTLSTPNADAKVHAKANFPSRGGQSAPSHQYRIGTGGNRSFPANGTTFQGQAGNQYVISVRSCRNDGAGDKCSAWTKSNQVTAWTKPATPSMSTSGSGTTRSISWSVPASSNGRKISSVQIKVNNGGWQNASRSGSESIEGYDKSLRVQVRARNSEGVYSDVNDTRVKTDPKPKPKVTVTRGRQITPSDIDAGKCPSLTCYLIKVTLTDFDAGTYKCEIESQRRGGADHHDAYPYSITVGSEGKGSQEGEAFRGDVGNAQVRAVCDDVDSGWTDW